MYKSSEKLQIIKKLKKLGYGGYIGDAIDQLEQQQFAQEIPTPTPTPTPVVNTLPTEPTEGKKKKKEKQSYTFNQNAMQNWIDESDALFRNSETGLLEGEKNHRDDVQSLYNSFMDADKHWLTKKENSHEAVPWSAATITNGIQAMYNLSDKEIKKALDPKNKGLFRHSTYINSSINAGEDGMFIASDIKNQNIGNLPIGSILFTGRGEAGNWDYDTIAKKAKKDSKYKAHSDFITDKGKDEIGYYVITTGGNRKNPDDKNDESFVSKKLYYDPETGTPIGFYNKKNKNFKSSTGKETKGYYKGTLESNQKYVTNTKIDPLYSNETLPQVNIEAQAGKGLIQMPTLKPKQISGPNRSAITSNESLPEVQRRYQDAALTRASTLPTPPLENEIDRSAMVNTSPKPKYTYVPEPEPEPKVETLPEVSITPKVKITPEQKAAYERYIKSKNNSNDLRNLDTRFAHGGFIKTKAPQRYVGKAYQDREHHAGFMEGDLANYTLEDGGPLTMASENIPQAGPVKGGPKMGDYYPDAIKYGMMSAINRAQNKNLNTYGFSTAVKDPEQPYLDIDVHGIGAQYRRPIGDSGVSIGPDAGLNAVNVKAGGQSVYKGVRPTIGAGVKFKFGEGGPLSGSNSGGPKKKKGTVGIRSTDSFMSNAYFNEEGDGIPFKSNMGEIIDLNLPQTNDPNIRYNPYLLDFLDME